MWTRCSKWYRIDANTPFAQTFACNIFNRCAACTASSMADVLCPTLGITMCLFTGLVWSDISLAAGLSLIFFGFLILSTPGLIASYKRYCNPPPPDDHIEV